MTTKNRTGLKALDKVANDKCVKEVYEDSDGIWVDLADGYNFEGCSALRGDTVASILRDWPQVEKGAPY